MKSCSVRKEGRRFWCKFQDIGLPRREIFYRIDNKLRNTGSLLDKKTELKC
jgi:hypothetical protein